MINQLKKYKRIAIGAGVAVVFVTIMIIPLLISQIAYMNKSACDQSSSSVIVDSDGSTQKKQRSNLGLLSCTRLFGRSNSWDNGQYAHGNRRNI